MIIKQIEELLRTLLGQSSTKTASTWQGEGDVAQQTKKPSNKMSQETMDAFRELNQVLQSAARRDMPRKSFEGVNFEDVKQATPGLTVDAFAPVGDLGLIPDIAGEPKESRKWGAEKDENLWSMIRRGLL